MNPRANCSQSPEAAPNAARERDDRLLTADELARRWQVRSKQVYSLTRAGSIPCVRIGRYCRYRLAAIEQFERDQEVGTNA